jgi:ABC-type nitrate/sulfonate/bicarbonate transport system substrate-binding protein
MKNTKLMASALVALLITASTIALTACGDKSDTSAGLEKLTLILDWTPNTNHAGIYEALDKDYYKDAGLDVEIQQPPEDGATPLVSSGKAQIGIDYQSWLGYALLEGSPVTAVATIKQHNSTALISLKEKNITRPRDLEGKRFAWDGHDASKAQYEYIIKKDGGNPEKVQWINTSVENIVSALQSDIDVVSGVYYEVEGIQAELAGLEINTLYVKDYAEELDEYSPIFIANNDYLASHGDTVRKFFEATKRGYTDAANDPTEAANILIKHVPELDGELTRESQAYISTKYIDDAESWGAFDLRRWNETYKWSFDNGLLEQELPENAGVTNEYVE